MSVLVRAEGVWKRYGRTDVLKGVDLEVNVGEVTCIIGPSGAGKSTFLRCINHLESIDSGRLTVGGELVGFREHGGRLYELKEKEVARKRANIGMVFQNFCLYPHMTARENVTLAPMLVHRVERAEAEKRADELLARVGLTHRSSNYPKQLSGGEQQRVAIARALAIDPSLMLFDEPTSALDPELVGEVLDVMAGLAQQGMTMIVVTHEISFARQAATTVALMDGGVIVESGPPHEVLENPAHARTRSFLGKLQ